MLKRDPAKFDQGHMHTCFYHLGVKIAAGQVSQNVRDTECRQIVPVCFLIRLYCGGLHGTESNTGCKVWCHESEMDMWPRGHNHLPLLIFHCSSTTTSTHHRNDASIPRMACLDPSVCACSSSMLHIDAAYSQQTSLSHPNARPDHIQRLSSNPLWGECACWLGVSVCVGWGWEMFERTLWQSSSTLAHRGFWLPCHSGHSHKKSNAGFCKTLQLYVRYLLWKVRIQWTDGRLGCPWGFCEEKNESSALFMLLSEGNWIPYWLSQFYFKFIKPGRIA